MKYFYALGFIVFCYIVYNSWSIFAQLPGTGVLN